jgi:quercetin 2,3-dioxygenase
VSDVNRRTFVKGALASGVVATPACGAANEPPAADPIRGLEPLQRAPWPTDDPFLFCAYHLDNYPKGTPRMGPAESLAGRQLGSDFSGRGGWSMYHGAEIPGFPRHPHRGFETVTVTRTGLVDHSDSLGATARYGDGDAQWMTAGSGIVHAEMFPLRHQEQANPLELFQVWLNLPAASKLVPPHFTMLWHERLPRHTFTDANSRTTEVVTIAGTLDGQEPPRPPPSSWASNPDAKVAIWTVSMAPNAEWTLPAATADLSRSLYFHRGTALTVAGVAVAPKHRIRLDSELPVALRAGPDGAEILMLQGRPIGEPIAHHGPFVMNTRAELQQAYADYRRSGFGGWPWPHDDPAHPPEQGRFAVHADGHRDEPEKA